CSAPRPRASIPGTTLMSLGEAETPPDDLTFNAYRQQRSFEAGSGSPFHTQEGVALYRAEWPNQPFRLLGEITFTSVAVRDYDLSAEWLAKKVIEAGGDAAVLTAVETLAQESVLLDGARVPVRRQRFRALAVKLLE